MTSCEDDKRELKAKDASKGPLRRLPQRPRAYDSGPRVAEMLMSLRTSRCYAQARWLHERLGQFAVAHHLDDGVVTRGQMLGATRGGTDKRTVLRHLDLLIECGAVEARGVGLFALADFTRYNLRRPPKTEPLAKLT